MSKLNVGTIAAILTTLSFIPQATKIFKTKDTSAISLPMYLMFVAGIFSWVIYGIQISDLNLLIANIITLILSGIILIYKIVSIVRGK